MFAQIALSGFVLGCIYSLFAVGLVVLYRATTVLNFSQGEFFMLGPYFVFTGTVLLQMSSGLSILLAIMVVALLGGIVFKAAFERLIDAPHINQVLVTVALIYVFQGMARVIWGSDIGFIRPLFGHDSMEFLGIVVTTQELCILGAVTIFTIIFSWVFLFTKAGKIMQAASQSLRGASLIGINVLKFHATMWIVSAGIAALTGILIGPLISVTPEMGTDIMLKSFAAMTLGGFGSIPGALVGGILMGIIENLTAFYISTALREISAFSIIIVILLIKPTGIMGVRLK